MEKITIPKDFEEKVLNGTKTQIIGRWKVRHDTLLHWKASGIPLYHYVDNRKKTLLKTPVTFEEMFLIRFTYFKVSMPLNYSLRKKMDDVDYKQRQFPFRNRIDRYDNGVWNQLLWHDPKELAQREGFKRVIDLILHLKEGWGKSMYQNPFKVIRWQFKEKKEVRIWSVIKKF